MNDALWVWSAQSERLRIMEICTGRRDRSEWSESNKRLKNELRIHDQFKLCDAEKVKMEKLPWTHDGR